MSDEGTTHEQVVEAQVDQLVGDILDVVEQPTDTPPEPAVAAPPNADPPATPTPPATPVETEKIVWQGQEVELPKEEIKKLAQMGFDYTKKTQELAAKSAELAPLEGLAVHIKNDPKFATHIAKYWQTPEQKKEEAPPEDPIERLKWETKAEAKEELRKEVIAPLQQQLHLNERQQGIERLKSEIRRDPRFEEVQAEMVKYIQSLPPIVGRNVYLQLDQDPQSYMETYRQFREKLPAQGNTTDNKTQLPAPIEQKERAPILEAAGNQTPHISDVEKERNRLARQRKTALRSGDPSAISDWLSGSGLIDHILKE